MTQSEPPVRNISDTACWAALYRARETERPTPLFRDPFAKKLAGLRGERIAAAIPFSDRNDWSWQARTWLFDSIITEQIRRGVDMVVNLAAGLDARPYRMDLPPTLKWVEVDLPGILDYKEEILTGEKPNCALERVRLDLSDATARRDLFPRLGQEATNVMLLSEGLLIYLPESDVATLAQDLAAPASFRHWVMDLTSPAVLRMLWRKMGKELGKGGARMQFGPAAGPDFFASHGWKSAEEHPMLKTAAHLKRLPLFLRFFASLQHRPRPFSGICRLERV